MIFICYASEDKEAAHALYAGLKARGLRPWMDKPPAPYAHLGIPPGVNWDDYIRKKISESHTFLACFSPTSINKKGYVQREYRHALDLMHEQPPDTVFFIPLLLHPCELPDLRIGSIRLHDLQQFDLESQGVDALADYLAGHWGRDPDVEAAKKLRDDLSTGFQTATHVSETLISGYEVAHHSKDIERLSCDFLSIIPLESGETAFLIGDVPGSGSRAAFPATALFNSIRSTLMMGATITASLLHVLQAVIPRFGEAAWLSCVLLVLDPMRHTIRWVNAGHTALSHAHANGEISVHRPNWPLLIAGIPESMYAEEEACTIENGDTIIAVSDGVVEVQNKEGTKYLGNEGMIDAIHTSSSRHGPLSDVLADVVTKVEAFGDIDDAQLLLAIRRNAS